MSIFGATTSTPRVAVDDIFLLAVHVIVALTDSPTVISSLSVSILHEGLFIFFGASTISLVISYVA